MKPASNFMSAASAVALSAGLIFSGAAAFQFAALTVAEAATVSSIEVRGNSRVDVETIRNYVGISPGESFSNADVNEAIKRLFGTGLFSDVSIDQSGSTLIVTVAEYSVVNQVLFQGNRKIKDRDLVAVTQLQPRGSYSQSMMEADAQAIRDAYAQIGRDDAVVSAQISELGDNRVNVIFDIQEGGRTKIASIDFVGNEAYGDGRLRGVIATKQSNPLSFLSRNDIYDEARLRADEELLRRYYYNRGYADFRVLSSTAQLNAAENEYTITITVDEGARYKFGDVEIESTVEGVDNESLYSLLETLPGGWYSAEDVEATLLALTERLAGAGFAFAQVTPRGNRNFENQTISVVYSIDQGPRAYVERIEIRGNERTRDYVIRREFDISEGDAFNQVMIQKAKRRLEDLNYFTTVNVSTVPGSQPDQVVLLVDVVEKSTGELSIGGGYTTGDSASSGFSVEGAIAERNFLGRGQSIRLSVAGGEHSRDYALSFTEPYFLGRRISAGFDIFRRTREYNDYLSEETGGTVRFGLPITEALSTQLAYNYSEERYEFSERCDDDDNGMPDADCGISPILVDAITNQSPWVKSSVSGSITYNTIDDLRQPREGIFANVTTEIAGLGGDAEFVKVTGRGTYYHLLNEQFDIVGLLSVGGGHISGFGDDELRVFDHFQSNTRIIRGFEYNGIGPFDSSSEDNDHLGGTTYFNASAEAQFPMPLIPESIGFRGAVFADAATLYGYDGGDFGGTIEGTDMEWRASLGAGIIWDSPFGPLRVDYAVPILKEDGDEVQNFNFGISTRF